MSLASFFHYLLLNMFRMFNTFIFRSLRLVCCVISCVVFLCTDRGFSISVLVYWRVISRDVCDYFNKLVSVNIDCCGVLCFLSSLVCVCFL